MDEQTPGVGSLKTALEAELSSATPDFGDVMARLSARGGEADYEEHVDLGEPPAIVAAACDALRARIEGSLQPRLRAAVVPPSFGDDRSGVRVWGVVVAIAVAALILGWVAVPSLFEGLQAASDDEGSLALDEAQRDERGGQVESSEDGSTAQRRVPARSVAPKPAPEPTPAVEEQQPETVAIPDAPAPLRTVRRSVDERIAALDARAQAKWKAGDRGGAARDFRKIVKIGGRRKAVELAYAELFALARQQGDDLSRLWRAYLRTFPKGRYAAEASAGLCRKAPLPDREDCWQAHRERFPKAGSAGRP